MCPSFEGALLKSRFDPANIVTAEVERGASAAVTVIIDVDCDGSSKVAERFWASLEMLYKLKQKDSEGHLDQGNIRVNSYVVDGRTIWGITYRIINILLGKA